MYYVDPSGNESNCWKKQSANKKAKVEDKNGQPKKKATIEENCPDKPKVDKPNNKSKGVNKYPPRTPLAEAECQKVVDMGNKIKLKDQMIVDYQATRKNPFSPVTCVFVHKNGTVSVGISGYYKGTRYTRHYANELQKALNKSAGYKKYTVSATADSDLIKGQKKQGDGCEPGMCAEPKAATAAHNKKEKVLLLEWM